LGRGHGKQLFRGFFDLRLEKGTPETALDEPFSMILTQDTASALYADWEYLNNNFIYVLLEERASPDRIEAFFHGRSRRTLWIRSIPMNFSCRT
jgi:hypothetical protein